MIGASEEAGFDVLVTADKNLAHQQALKGKSNSVIVLASLFTNFAGIAPLADLVLAALEDLQHGAFLVVKPT